MNESLASLLMKNIDLILEAYNVDDKNNLVEVNKKKVAESDEIFHQYFVKSMNSMFRQINENDPILQQPAGCMMRWTSMANTVWGCNTLVWNPEWNIPV